MLFAGGKRFAHLMYLGESHYLLAKLFAIEKFPKAATTLTRFFGKVKSWIKAEALHIAIQSFLMSIIPWSKVKEDDLSFDSHVCVRYGRQVARKERIQSQEAWSPQPPPDSVVFE